MPLRLIGYDPASFLGSPSRLKVKAISYQVHHFEPILEVSRPLPVHIVGAVLPKPAITEVSVEGCLRKRLFHQTPGFNHKTMRKLRGFVLRWCRANLRPLDEIASFEEWIEETNYGKRRKEELRQIYYDSVPDDVFKARVKCHVKDEFYEALKWPRMISSREDVAKVHLGPIFHSIEKILYKMPFFVKGLTEQQRVDRIIDIFGDRTVYVTDYSAFETHFVEKLMCNCEMVVYNYLLSSFPEARRLIKVLTGRNRLTSKFFHGTLDGVRMSGEMNTSLGNGISNYLLMCFIAQQENFTIVNALVEGDDGLFEIRGAPPTAQLVASKYGLELKIDRAVPHTASFCGCIFNPVTRTNFGHVLKHLVSFGWMGRRHFSLPTKRQLELTMSRVYSFNALYPGVPLLFKLCELCIRHFPKVTYVRCLKYLDRYRSSTLWLTEDVRTPLPEDRCFFYELTGISPAEQLQIEDDFEHSFPALHSELLLSFLSEDWVWMWTHYVELGER